MCTAVVLSVSQIGESINTSQSLSIHSDVLVRCSAIPGAGWYSILRADGEMIFVTSL